MSLSEITQTVVEIPLEFVDAGNNDRKTFDPAAMDDLVASIKANGLKQPITVVRVQDGDAWRYRIVMGERRYRAHRILGLPTIRAMVDDLDPADESVAMLIENVQRDDLDPLDEAHGYESRMAEFGWSDEELARRSGIKLDRIRKRLDLLRLSPEIQGLMAAGQLTVGMAWEMTRLDDQRQRLALAAMMKKPDMGWWTWNALCKRLAAEQAEQVMFDPESFFQLEEIVEQAARKNYSIKGMAALAERAADTLRRARGVLVAEGYVLGDQWQDLLDEIDEAVKAVRK